MKSIVLSVRATCALATLWFALGHGVLAHAQDTSPLDDLDQGPDAPAEDAPAEGAPSEAAEAPAEEAAEAPAEEAAEAPAEAEAAIEPAAEEAPPPPPSNTEEMVVTGSRVKHTRHALPTSVEVMDRKALQRSGANNMSEVVRTMNINRGSEFNTAVSTAAVGTSQFNLRGLGLSSTLVLLNGRRLVQSGAASIDGSNFVDINTIPMPLVERIEILKGGASAIYGSDAVAGVVNMITRKHVNGFEAQVGGQSTTAFDQQDWDVSLLGGAESENSRVVGVVTFFKRSALDASDRDFTANTKNTSTLGWPSTYLALKPDLSGAVTMANAMGMPVPVAHQDPQCGKVRLSAPTQDPAAALPFCTFNFNSYFMLLAPEERLNVYTTVEHDVGDHVTLFIEGGYARNRAWRTTSPSYPILSTIVVPPDNMNNMYGAPLKWYGRVDGGLSPAYRSYFDSDTVDTVAGVKGDLGGISESAEDWEWEISGTYGSNRYSAVAQDVLKGPLQTALNSCKPGDDPANCWNPFADGTPNSQAAHDKITGELIGVADTQLYTAGADLGGPLFKLPGGDLGVAVGAQYRRETLKANYDHDSNQLNYLFLLGGPDYAASRNIGGGYGELVMPFFQGFELQTAGRFEHYSDAGSSFNPMFGISWTPATTFAGEEASPASKVLIRGTFTTAYRAPSLLQEYGSTTALEGLYDVNADPMTGMPVQSMTQTFRAVTTRGNLDLKPQKSNAITAGIEWNPVNGFRIQGDYWRYDYTDLIVKEKAQQLIDADYRWMTMPDTRNPNIERDPLTGSPTRINAKFVNASSAVTDGIDVGVNYATDFGGTAGTFGVGADGTYVLSYVIPQSSVTSAMVSSPDGKCSGGKCDVAGFRNYTNFARPIPQLRASFPITWFLDAHSASVVVRVIGGYKDDENPAPMTFVFPDIKPWMAVDLQYSFTIHESEKDKVSTTFRVGVLNLLDALPPSVNTQLGYDVLTHDPRGRMIYGRLIQEL